MLSLLQRYPNSTYRMSLFSSPIRVGLKGYSVPYVPSRVLALGQGSEGDICGAAGLGLYLVSIRSQAVARTR